MGTQKNKNVKILEKIQKIKKQIKSFEDLQNIDYKLYKKILYLNPKESKKIITLINFLTKKYE